jgi:hypothetical protein
MRSTTANVLFNSAVESAVRNTTKWDTDRETHNFMYALEEASGIPYWAVNIAVNEAVAQRMLTDLFDVCSKTLGQNLSARAQYDRSESDARHKQHTIAQPMFNAVARYIDWLTYHTETSPDHHTRQNRWWEFLATKLDTFDGKYTPEFCDTLRVYIAENAAEALAAKGGAA